MEIYIPQFGFLLLILVIPDVSTRGNPPFNNLTYVYRISRKVANTVPIFDETTFDSVIQCGVFCVSNPKCYSAFFSIEEGICMLSEDTLDTYFMSPSYQAWVEDLGSILYIDLDGWVSPCFI